MVEVPEKGKKSKAKPDPTDAETKPAVSTNAADVVQDLNMDEFAESSEDETPAPPMTVSKKTEGKKQPKKSVEVDSNSDDEDMGSEDSELDDDDSDDEGDESGSEDDEE